MQTRSTGSATLAHEQAHQHACARCHTAYADDCDDEVHCILHRRVPHTTLPMPHYFSRWDGSSHRRQAVHGHS
eukprot:9130750-Alexandrium_andersonii.AAC.1